MQIGFRLGKKEINLIEFFKTQENKSWTIKLLALIAIELFGKKDLKKKFEDTLNREGIKGVLNKIK